MTAILTFRTAIACAALLAAPALAHADQARARFNANVNNTCTLVISAAGVLANSNNDRILDSRLSGGGGARLTANATARGFRIRALAPSAFTSSPSPQAAAFSSWYSLSGATTATAIPGATQTTLNRGTHQVVVDLEARKSGGGAFANGSYSADVLVRCE